MRGVLVESVRKRARELLGREITTDELRLMPYIQFVMVNEQFFDNRKLNSADREVIRKWQDEGYLELGAENVMITKKFWDIINELIYLSYVERRGV